MKKYLFILAASAALVACSKNELTPAASVADQEITYTVAPKVKAEQTFKEDWTFKSTAFYLANGKTWEANHTSADVATYIGQKTDNIGIDISYVAKAEGSTDKVWRNATTKYYWPKDGTLTFFAWTSLNLSTISAEMDGSNVKATETKAVSYLPAYTTTATANAVNAVNVSKTDGVKVYGYDVVTNKNLDLLVADIKADKGANDAKTYYHEGVTTLFHHKLSQVFFTAQTKDGYDYENNDGVTFTINSIKFVGIDKVGTYTQGYAGATDSWSNSNSDTQTYYDKEKSTSTSSPKPGQKVTKTVTPLVNLNGEQQYYYLPQKFTSQTAADDAAAAKLTSDVFVVNYTIAYANGTTETIDKVCILNNSDTSKTSVFDEWKIGYKYTINLQFALDEILWDPAVEEWKTDNKDVPIQ